MRYYVKVIAAALAYGIIAAGASLMCALAVGGCAKVDNVVDRGKALVVDCTRKEAAQAITELGPLVESTLLSAVDGDGKPSLDPLKDAATRWTADLAGCVLADVVSRALVAVRPDPLAPKASTMTPLEIHAAELREQFYAFKALHFGGVTFKLPDGRKL